MYFKSQILLSIQQNKMGSIIKIFSLNLFLLHYGQFYNIFGFFILPKMVYTMINSLRYFIEFKVIPYNVHSGNKRLKTKTGLLSHISCFHFPSTYLFTETDSFSWFILKSSARNYFTHNFNSIASHIRATKRFCEGLFTQKNIMGATVAFCKLSFVWLRKLIRKRKIFLKFKSLLKSLYE